MPRKLYLDHTCYNLHVIRAYDTSKLRGSKNCTFSLYVRLKQLNFIIFTIIEQVTIKTYMSSSTTFETNLNHCMYWLFLWAAYNFDMKLFIIIFFYDSYWKIALEHEETRRNELLLRIIYIKTMEFLYFYRLFFWHEMTEQSLLNISDNSKLYLQLR